MPQPERSNIVLTAAWAGIIPRAVTSLFEMIYSRTDMSYNVKVSYMEIYNEQASYKPNTPSVHALYTPVLSHASI